MKELNTLYLTFNCARTLIHTDFFAASISKGLSKKLLPPDLIVLSLQEVAPVGQSFLGGSFLSPYLERFNQAVQKAALSWNYDERYETVLASNIGMTAIMLFAKPEIARRITRVETGGTGVGMWEMGNKGAVGARLAYSPGEDEQEIDLTFVAAHLAPMEDAWVRRNLDWRVINENLVFTSLSESETSRTNLTNDAPEETEALLSSATDDQSTRSPHTGAHALITPDSYTFFGGDLNYRTSDIPPHPTDHQTWPSRNDSPSNPQHYSQLLSRDQLAREKAAGKTLQSLSEAPVTFEPTYKYSHRAQAQAEHSAALITKQARLSSNDPLNIPDETDWLWAHHRHPSWCDRILFLDPGVEGCSPIVHTYHALPLQPTSDHKPVVLHVSIPTKPLPKSWVSAPFPLVPGWKERRDAARRREVIVGILAYLTMTWEGRALFIGTILGIIGGWAALRSLLAF